MTARISPATERRVLALWTETGHSSRLVAEHIGISPTTVLRVLDRNGVTIDPSECRLRKRRTTPEQDAEIVARYVAGESADALAAEFGFKFHLSVIQRVRAAGFEIRRPGGRLRPITNEEGEEILRLRNEEGLSQERIARRLNISQWRISRFLVENGHRTWELTRHPSYSGGAAKASGGYLVVRVTEDDPIGSPMASASGYVREHRLVMARALGRPLLASETVHHINGDRADNRLENLQLRVGAHGKGVQMACLDCGSHRIAPVPLSAS